MKRLMKTMMGIPTSMNVSTSLLTATTAFVTFGASLFLVASATAATYKVDVAPGGALIFSPQAVSIQPGDTVMWTWDRSGHTVTSGVPGGSTGLFDSGIRNNGFTFSFTFSDPGTYNYFCTPHGNCCGMVGSVMVAGPVLPPSQAQLLNISTRMRVETGDNVLIGGFIVTGSQPKKVLLRALGPSLSAAGVSDALADPVLELHGPDGALITSNDNWRSDQEAEISATNLAPAEDLESAILATLTPDSYTAIVSGKNGVSGVGLVEGYDLDQPADSQLANISTRGFVQTGDNVMIGGFILGNGAGTTNILIRALGPSLANSGVSGVLADPTLELHDANGALVMSNNNWNESQQAEIDATGLAPQNAVESAILVTVPTAAYTAIVAGNNGLTGVALVEVYRLP